MIKTLRKYLTVYKQLIKNCLAAQMEYRLNFIIFLIFESGMLFTKLIYLGILYNIGVNINGYSPDAMLLFIGTFVLMTAIYTGLFIDSFYDIPRHIRNGFLDVLMTKPISLQFIVTMRKVNFAMPIPNLIGGLVMIIIAWNRLELPVNFLYICGFIGIIISGTIISYSIFLIPQILSFWVVKTSAITQIVDKCWDFNNMPMIIYSGWIKRIGVFIFPVFVISNFPPLFLLNKLNQAYVLWVFIAPVLFFYIARKFWCFAVRNYSSASS